MKIRCFIQFLLVISMSIFVSCGTDVKKTEIKNTDTSGVKISDELKSLNDQLAQNPNNSDAYHLRAKYYFADKKYEAGFADINAALKLDSSKSAYYLTLADLCFVSNQTGKAKTALEKSIKLDSKNVDAMLNLAELYLYVRKHEKSIEYINMALKINQYNAKAYFMKGMNYKELKDTLKAISSMQTAVEQDQLYYAAYMQLGILCAAKKNKLAIQYYKNALRIQPKSIESWYDLGKCYQDMQDWNNSLGAYTSLLQIDAKNKYAHYNMGVINLMIFKKYEEAISHFSEAIKIEPKYVEAYYSRGISQKLKGDTKKALLDFQACIDINPSFKPAELELKKVN